MVANVCMSLLWAAAPVSGTATGAIEGAPGADEGMCVTGGEDTGTECDEATTGSLAIMGRVPTTGANTTTIPFPSGEVPRLCASQQPRLQRVATPAASGRPVTSLSPSEPDPEELTHLRANPDG